MKNLVRLLLLWLVALVASLNAQAQSASDYSLTDFKINSLTTPVKLYSKVNTSRILKFSVTVTHSSNVAAIQPQIYLVGKATSITYDYDREAQYSGATTSRALTYVSNVYEGSIVLNYGDMYYSSGAIKHDGIQAVVYCCGYGGPLPASSAKIGITPATSSAGAVTFQDFAISNATPNNGANVTVTANPDNKTYSLTVFKDIAYTDEIYINLKGKSSSGTSASINSGSLSISNSNWASYDSNRLVYSFTNKTIQLSTADIGSNDYQLVVLATGYTNPTGEVIGSSSPINLYRPPVACGDDVLLQNTSKLSGNIVSGGNLRAGRMVTNTTQGDVLIKASTTVSFVASNEVRMEDGFAVESGASFSAIQNGGQCSVARFRSDSTDISVAPDSPTAAQRTSTILQTATATNTNVESRIAGVYPNPAQSVLTVVLPAGSVNSSQAIIYNNAGAEVLRADLTGVQTTFDVHNLAPGIYNLHTIDKGQAVNRRFSIVR